MVSKIFIDLLKRKTGLLLFFIFFALSLFCVATICIKGSQVLSFELIELCAAGYLDLTAAACASAPAELSDPAVLRPLALQQLMTCGFKAGADK